MSKDKTPTQKGGDDSKVRKETPESNPNNQHRDALADQFAQQRAEELGEEVLADGHTSEAVEPAPEPEPEPAPEPEPEGLDDDQPTGDGGGEDDDLVELNVQGEVQKVSRAKVHDAGVRFLQKEAAVDKQLQEAAKANREAQELLANARKGTPAGEEPPATTPSSLDVSEVAKKIAHGDESDVAEAVETIVQGAQSATPEPVDVRGAVSDELAFKEAITGFQTDFPDVWGDERLRQMAYDLDDKAVGEGDRRPYAERFAGWGKEVREWVGSFGGGKETPTEKTTLETRRERKQGLSTPGAGQRPGAGSNSRSTAPPELTDEQRNNAAIEEMAAGRRPQG